MVERESPPQGRGYTLRVMSIAIDRLLDAATGADERVPVFSIKADWARDGNFQHPASDLTSIVKSFTVSQELASDLPAQVGFVEGTSATTLQMTLGGTWEIDNVFGDYERSAVQYLDGQYRYYVDAMTAFSPYGPSVGAVLNRTIQLRTGFLTAEGEAQLVRFTGLLSNYAPTASSREVAITALDPVSKLRKSITIYAHGVDGVVLTRYGNRLYPWVVNSQWYIDRILRHNGYYASPPPGGNSAIIPDYTGDEALVYNVVLSATMHGSHQHEIGNFTYPITNAYSSSTATNWIPPWEYGATADPDDPVAHPFQMMYPRPGFNAEVTWITRSAAAMRPGIDGWGMSGWIRLPAAGSTLNTYIWSYLVLDGFAMQMRLVNGVPHAYIIYPFGGGSAQGLYTTGGFALSAQPRWIFAGVHFASTVTGVQISMNFDGQYASVLLDGYPIPQNIPYFDAARAVGQTVVPWTNFSVWYSPVAPGPLDWRGESWEPTAYVDPGLSWMGGQPDIVARESYELLKEIVAGEFGTFYFDETGKPFFRSRIVDRGWNRPPEVITSDRDISDLVMNVDESSLRNAIDARFAPLVIGGWETIFEPDDPYYFTLGANQFNTWLLPVPDDVVSVAETSEQIVKWVSSENWGEIEDNPYYYGKLVFCASLLSDPTIDVYSAVLAGQLATAQFVFNVRRIDQKTVAVRISSSCPYGVRFATASKAGTNSGTGRRDNGMVTEGTPAFRLPGRKIVEGISATANLRHERSIYNYGLQSYDLGGDSPWRQTADSTYLLAGSVMKHTANPRPILGQVETPHNPRRRLRDKIVVVEPDAFGARIWCTIHGITTTFDENGARDTLTLRPDEAPPSW